MNDLFQIASLTALGTSLASIGAFLFKAGKWTGKMEELDDQMHDLETRMQSYVSKELYAMKMQTVENQLKDISAEVKASNKIMRLILSRMVGLPVNIAEVDEA